MSTFFICPLCLGNHCRSFHRDRERSYQKCTTCSLVFVEPEYLPAPSQELKEYQLHENNPEDPGYRKFLSRLIAPLQQRLPINAVGLDFGCGPGPTLSLIMAKAGWKMAIYDPFFVPDNDALNHNYDFITATEVIEHIHKPSTVLPFLWQRLNAGGYLAIMTKLVIDQEAFTHWHYKNDPTHVCFYSIDTFRFLANWLNAEVEFIDRDVIFLRKS